MNLKTYNCKFIVIPRSDLLLMRCQFLKQQTNTPDSQTKGSAKLNKNTPNCHSPGITVESRVSVHVLRAVLVALLRREGRRRLTDRVLARQVAGVGVRTAVIKLQVNNYLRGQRWTSVPTCYC